MKVMYILASLAIYLLTVGASFVVTRAMGLSGPAVVVIGSFVGGVAGFLLMSAYRSTFSRKE